MRPAGGVSSAYDLERSHMHRKLWLSAVMAALGALLLVVAGFAHAASSSAAKKGGTMRLNMSATDVDFSDPSLAYGTISWQIEYATGLKLVNYPDKAPPLGSRLQAEAAAGLPHDCVHDSKRQVEVLENRALLDMELEISDRVRCKPRLRQFGGVESVCPDRIADASTIRRWFWRRIESLPLVLWAPTLPAWDWRAASRILIARPISP